MSKRKRGGEDSDGGETTSSDYRQQRRIASAFTTSATELWKAFKLARGFERQKLGRRKKNAAAAKDDKELQRIDAEIAALKTLDLTACAQHHLQRSLLKIKAVATDPQIPAHLGKLRSLSTDTAVLNVNARLCNSNPVREAFPALVGAVKREFGIEDVVDGPGNKRRVRKKDYVEEVDNSEFAGFSDEEDLGPQEHGGQGDGEEHDASDLDPDLEEYNGRLASSDEEGSEASDLDIEDLERQLELEGIAQTRKPAGEKSSYDHAAALSLSEDESEQSEEELPKRAEVAKKSSFIPSLSLGGYISGSGSDIDDDFDVAPKKNRRGQRARQQIWEKKFGSRAKHLQGQSQNQSQSRSQGWDAKRGAVDTNQRVPRFANGANTEKLGKTRVPAPVQEKRPPKKDDSGPLHPSWEAAKRAKEKKSAPVAFQGKKISFD